MRKRAIPLLVTLFLATTWWAGNRLPRLDGSSPAAFAVTVPPPALPAGAADAPAIVLITASWCLPCRQLEHDWLAHLERLRAAGRPLPRFVVLEPRDAVPSKALPTSVVHRLSAADLARAGYLRPPVFPTVWELGPGHDVRRFRIGYDGSARARAEDYRSFLRVASERHR